MNSPDPISILVVDDDDVYRNSMRRLFWTIKDDFPARVLEAANGREALDTLRREKIECVLLDHRMPGGDGTFWIAKFLDLDSCLPIVMVTGQGDEATAVKAMKQGALDYLVKGAISAEALQRAIINAVEKMTMRRRMAAQQKALLLAERHRGMIESLAAACHRLGQPMTVVTMCLEMMREKELDREAQTLIDQCNHAAAAVNDILQRLQQVGFFQAEPYCDCPEEDGDSFSAWLAALDRPGETDAETSS